MENYQGIIVAECIAHDRLERAENAAARWYLTNQGTPQPTLRESLADALIALAHRIAPQRTDLTLQHH